MASYTSDELRLIEAARRSLEADKLASRRVRMLMDGIPAEEAERRLLQSQASKMAHFQSRLGPRNLEAPYPIPQTPTPTVSTAQPASSISTLLAPTGRTSIHVYTEGLEGKILSYLGKAHTATALNIARSVVDAGLQPASKADVNPTLYKMQDRGLIIKLDVGWRIVRGKWLKTVKALLQQRSYTVLELMALSSAPYETVDFILKELDADDALESQLVETPSGSHLYYRFHGSGNDSD
mgnify:CR=1 FL=1